jgi:hypothetical protein
LPGRTLTAGKANFGFIAGAFVSIPAIALGSGAIYYLERFFVLLVGSFIVFTIFFWGVIRGKVPSELSRQGLKWPEEVTSTTNEAIDGLQTQISRLANHPAIPLVHVRDFARHADLATMQGYVHKIESAKVTAARRSPCTPLVPLPRLSSAESA